MKMRNNKLLIGLIALASPLIGQCSEVPDWLVGAWQSNEKLTLNDMRQHPEIPITSRQKLENGFFGKMVHVYRKEEGAYYFNDNKPDKIQFEKYREILITVNSVTFIEFSQVFDKEVENTLYRDGSCFYMVVSKWKFKEYFCPLEK